MSGAADRCITTLRERKTSCKPTSNITSALELWQLRQQLRDASAD
jgi:hypothetical protein